MSRVFDALRKAENLGLPLDSPPPPEELQETPARELNRANGNGNGSSNGNGNGNAAGKARGQAKASKNPLNAEMLADVQVVPFQPAHESHLLDLDNNHETPAEEFRTLRTRLNHLA